MNDFFIGENENNKFITKVNTSNIRKTDIRIPVYDVWRHSVMQVGEFFGDPYQALQWD